MTLDQSNSGDDRGRDQHPASHQNDECDDASEAAVTPDYAVRSDGSFASVGVTDRDK